MPKIKRAIPTGRIRKTRKVIAGQGRKSAGSRSRHNASSNLERLAQVERRVGDASPSLFHPTALAEPRKPLVMWTVYKHPKDYPDEYVAKKFVITDDCFGPNNESISSSSLRDVRTALRSLYSGLVQLKRPLVMTRISWKYGSDTASSLTTGSPLGCDPS
jgi:hypothetical protein